MHCMTADVIVRDAVPSDAGACAAVYRGYVTDSSVSFETEPPTVEEMARRIVTSQASHAWIVAEVGGDVVGYALRHPPIGSARHTGSRAMSACISTLPGSATGSGAACMSCCSLGSPRTGTAWPAQGSFCPTPGARRCTGRWDSPRSGSMWCHCSVRHRGDGHGIRAHGRARAFLEASAATRSMRCMRAADGVTRPWR
jgi:hypothetical protein